MSPAENDSADEWVLSELVAKRKPRVRWNSELTMEVVTRLCRRRTLPLSKEVNIEGKVRMEKMRKDDLIASLMVCTMILFP